MRCSRLVTPTGEQDDEPARFGQGNPGWCVAVLRPGSSVHRFGELGSDAADGWPDDDQCPSTSGS
ncbi:hypothetical protein CSHISOI_11800, partial [Colletotrichum shisoi]